MTREHRVFGPPGTGKTTFLQKQVQKWASEIGVEGLMCASFTRAAAAELRGRDLPLARHQIGTLHSFAYRALDGPELVVKHVRDFNDSHPAYRLSVDQHAVDIDDPNYEASFGVTDADRLLSQTEVLRARMVPRDHWPAAPRGFMHAWETWKHDTELVDFTDLIELAIDNTSHAPGAPDAACFDEVQDFTPLELTLVRRWGARMERVLLAGDDDQCIYGFKGATPDAFLQPPVPDEQKRVLSRSYRLPVAVHACAQQWIAQLSRREAKAYEPRHDDDERPVQGAVRAILGANFRDPGLVLRDAYTVLESGRSVMLLTTCAYMLDAVKALLRREGIPFHNPYRRKRGDWNPLQPGSAKRRTASDRLLAFLRTQHDVWGDDARWWTGEDLKQWSDPLKQDGVFTRGMKSKIDALPGAEAVDAAWFDGELLDPRHVEANAERIMGGDVEWYYAHLLGSKRKPFEFPVQVARRRGAAVLREPPRLIIGTIHSVKGGQADVVYLFPDLSAPAMRQWLDGNVEARDEVIRQMYVGMTRARDELVLCGQASPMAVDPTSILRCARST